MVMRSSTFRENLRSILDPGDRELEEIVSQVHEYLYNFGQKRILLAMGRSYYQRCCRSWAKITSHLGKFLQDPRTNYSMMIIVLEHEIQKFPQRAFYTKKLKALEKLVSMGLNFSITELSH